MSTTQREPSAAAAGWIMFAGVIMVAVGSFQAFAGLVGILEDEFYAITPEYVVQFDATSGAGSI